MSNRLAGKVALVTGTSPNIGGALAAGLAAAGARVACNDVDAATAQACAHAINDAGGEATAAVFDATDEAAARDGVDAVLDRWGQIDILVNNAVKFDNGGVRDWASRCASSWATTTRRRPTCSAVSS
jgi:NAD(P)-dependent dehydrogenase (short-subunit alcohol dehydrogenase family)